MSSYIKYIVSDESKYVIRKSLLRKLSEESKGISNAPILRILIAKDDKEIYELDCSVKVRKK